MHYLDLTFPEPELNLSLDESLLDICELGGKEILRTWESETYFVAMGLSGKVEREVFEEACRRDGISIQRRMTGGGTVLVGPGCLNYSLIIRKNRHPAFQRPDTTHHFLLDRLAEGLRLIHPDITREGIGDLAINGMKVSGNAQRRLRRAILYHGTLLYDFDFSRVDCYLKEPERQPAYRMGRGHGEFLRNLQISSEFVKVLIRKVWNPPFMDDWPGGWDAPGATVALQRDRRKSGTGLACP